MNNILIVFYSQCKGGESGEKSLNLEISDDG